MVSAEPAPESTSYLEVQHVSTSTTVDPTTEDRFDTTVRMLFRLADDFGVWWGQASRSARGLAVGILTVIGGLVLLSGWAVLDLLGWVGNGLVHLIGHDGVHALAAWRVSHVISDPLHHYLATAGAGLPASPQTLTIGWAVAAGVLLLGALAGIRGARIGWAVIGAATTAMVYAGTPAAGHLVAAAVTVAAWALLSIPAYWRHGPRDPQRVLVVRPKP